MNRRFLCATVGAAALFTASFVAVAWLKPAPRLLWNASASAPIGVYRIDVGARPRLGELVAIDPPPALAIYLSRRGYLPRGVPLLKRVAALPGSLVCRSGASVTIDGAGVARALARDGADRPLPVWRGCRIVGAQELFLINAARGSLDGRYFGPISASGLIGTAHPVLTRTDAEASLRWHRASPSFEPIADEMEQGR
ncbi:S26 family signal peptidase [Sphingopyxis alaskensis]|jgi:conjugative transfer signal peptidase TraF|uniref:Conjugal transfer protein traF n=1 Tax=Sphingopyxis alaskensis (strain DSM 13593 / LMG 18877 / RB2256) TaxID=317655 RepID=Q1GQ72_SPHAL|nr:S26 family signal peptidase [Sphingopyxis alaskensis]ABF54200.1 conjugal transfer protein traF [Sphingopyxis alaskensis RB2256]MCM3420750.1 S26 family signal peptidase [Sphingopyxis alaskensis]